MYAGMIPKFCSVTFYLWYHYSKIRDKNKERKNIKKSAGKYDFVPGRKNMQALARYGLTITGAGDEILGLEVSVYR